jgi:hypothetical protein
MSTRRGLQQGETQCKLLQFRIRRRAGIVFAVYSGESIFGVCLWSRFVALLPFGCTLSGRFSFVPKREKFFQPALVTLSQFRALQNQASRSS